MAHETAYTLNFKLTAKGQPIASAISNNMQNMADLGHGARAPVRSARQSIHRLYNQPPRRVLLTGNPVTAETHSLKSVA